MSGEITRTPDLILTSNEKVTNDKLNRLGGGTFQVNPGSISATELSVALTGGFGTVDDLRTNTDTFGDNVAVGVSGYYTDGDGDFGPPLFVDTGDTTTADNGVTCFVDANGLRFKRDLAGYCELTWAGGKGDDSTDNSNYVTAAKAILPADGGVIHIPAGTWRVSGSLADGASTQRIEFSGAGVSVTTIKPTADIDVITLNTSGSKVRDLTIDGSLVTSAGTGSGIHIGGTHAPYFCELKNVFISQMCSDGVKWTNGPNLRTEGLLVNNVQGHGLHFPAGDLDNNHGLVHAQVTRAGVIWDAVEENWLPTGVTKYGLYIPNGTSDSQSHVFQNFKIFGCPYGAIYCGSDYSVGTFFVENNKELMIGKATFTNATNIVNRTAHGLSNGDRVIISNEGGGTMPTGLTAEVYYHVVSANTNDFQVSLTNGGAAVTFSDDGSGNIWIREWIEAGPVITLTADSKYHIWHLLGDVTDGQPDLISDSGINEISYVSQGVGTISSRKLIDSLIIRDNTNVGRLESTLTANNTVQRLFTGSSNDFIENWEHSESADVDMRAGHSGHFLLNGFALAAKGPTLVKLATFATDFATDANQIDATAHGLVDGNSVTLTTTTTLPAGLSLATTYYLVNTTTNAFELATSIGGTPITLTSDGTGTHTFRANESPGVDAADIYHQDFLIDATNGALTLTLGYYLQRASGGRIININRIDTSTNTVIVDGGAVDAFGSGGWRQTELVRENKTLSLLNVANATTPRWRVMSGDYEVEFTWNPASLADAASVSSGNITITNGPNAQSGCWYVIPPYDTQELMAFVNVTSSSTVEIILNNNTGGAIDLGSGNWIVGMKLS